MDSVREKQGPRLRCSYCHGDLDLAYQLPCSGCGTLVHAECRVQAGGCPTIGCARSRADAQSGTHERRRVGPPSPDVVLNLVGWAALACGALGMTLSFMFMGVAASVFLVIGAAGFVAGAVLIAAGSITLGLLRLAQAAERAREAPR